MGNIGPLEMPTGPYTTLVFCAQISADERGPPAVANDAGSRRECPERFRCKGARDTLSWLPNGLAPHA